MRVAGRLVLADAVSPGRVVVADGRIAAIELDDREAGGPFVAPGLIDVHLHGWGGHDAMGSPAELDGMARSLLRRGVTSFLPTAVSAPLPRLVEFASTVRRFLPAAPPDGAEPLGFNLEGPFLAPSRKGAHDADALRVPRDVPWAEIRPLLDGLRVITVAPELDGATELIERLAAAGVVVALGHSAAGLDAARAGFAAGAGSTTHLFNAMTGVDHHAPGLATAALGDDDAWVELIADGHHVDPALWPLVVRTKPPGRVVLVSDALAIAGTDLARTRLGSVEIVVREGRATLVDGGALGGALAGLADGVRNLARSGVPLPAAVATATANPAALLGETDRGRLAVGFRAHLVELDDELRVRRTTRGGGWVTADA